MRLRYTENSLRESRAQLDTLRESLDKANTFLGLLNPQFWKLLTEDLDGRVEALTNYRDANLKVMGESELKANLAEERAYRWIKGLPQRVESRRTEMMKNYKKLNEETHERAARIKKD